ncbi:MAG: helix-turn-helix transcriptional regulator [Euryarchaeota archaeon]|nr:helix-turn-helix transcriptional regulator [Euryarchaeota archaeon]MDE1836743.1 helix-turn-helix transcriptional regulator [Euryarchaeota archaeon]MDE1879761.1 helix-turn-helix transcriptional regulator [Euryarchaeota archaeon]MDE2044727.1 helix-turn-helix transcriptional regulator [Thermoplasmata archaeon]
MIREGGRVHCIDPASGVLDLLGKRWGLPLVVVLGNRPTSRFHELEASIPGIGRKLLAQRLKELAAEGIALRRVHPQFPLRVSYRLTPRGKALRSALLPLLDWASAGEGEGESSAAGLKPRSPGPRRPEGPLR